MDFDYNYRFLIIDEVHWQLFKIRFYCKDYKIYVNDHFDLYTPNNGIPPLIEPNVHIDELRLHNRISFRIPGPKIYMSYLEALIPIGNNYFEFDIKYWLLFNINQKADDYYCKIELLQWGPKCVQLRLYAEDKNNKQGKNHYVWLNVYECDKIIIENASYSYRYSTIRKSNNTLQSLCMKMILKYNIPHTTLSPLLNLHLANLKTVLINRGSAISKFEQEIFTLFNCIKLE
jgi:hypothetical protein